MVLFLVIVGGLPELVGIGMALREVHQRCTDAKAYADRPLTGHANGHINSTGTLTATAKGTAQIGPPTLEQRVAALEQAVGHLPDTTRSTVEGAVRESSTANSCSHLRGQQRLNE